MSELSCACNSAARTDPTHSLILRQKFEAEFKRRYTRVKRTIVDSIVVNDAFGINRTPDKFSGMVFMQAAQPGQFSGRTLDEQVAAFDEWFAEELRIEIEEQADPEKEENSFLWLLILAAFGKGLFRGRAEAARAGYPVTRYTATPLPRQIMANPGVSERVFYILSRSFEDLKGVNVAMRSELRRILAQAIAEGVDTKTMARRITAIIDSIGIRRATLIARTETIAAHHMANIAEYRAAGVIGVRLLAEWVTAGDARVCPKCQELARMDNGMGPGIYTLDMIEFMIPAHPGCRCVALPTSV